MNHLDCRMPLAVWNRVSVAVNFGEEQTRSSEPAERPESLQGSLAAETAIDCLKTVNQSEDTGRGRAGLCDGFRKCLARSREGRI